MFQDHQEQLEIRVQRVRPDHKVLKALKDPRASGEKLEAQEPKDELERPENLAREDHLERQAIKEPRASKDQQDQLGHQAPLDKEDKQVNLVPQGPPVQEANLAREARVEIRALKVLQDNLENKVKPVLLAQLVHLEVGERREMLA